MIKRLRNEKGQYIDPVPEPIRSRSLTQRKRKMEIKKKRFLKAYVKTGYNVGEACKQAGVSRAYLSEWKKKDPEFANAMWEIEESITDFVEGQMLKQIRNNNPAMIMWFLETKGKTRGYTRKFEVENNVKIELSTEQIDAMVEAYALAEKDDMGRLKMPALTIGEGNGTDGKDGQDPIDAEYRETGQGDEEAGSETAGSEVPGTQ